jgi:hypothetical protein
MNPYVALLDPQTVNCLEKIVYVVFPFNAENISLKEFITPPKVGSAAKFDVTAWLIRL